MPYTPGSQGEKIAELKAKLEELKTSNASDKEDRILQTQQEIQAIENLQNSEWTSVIKVAAKAELLQSQPIEALQKELLGLEKNLEKIKEESTHEQIDQFREEVESYKLAIEKKQQAYSSRQSEPLKAIAPAPGSRGEKLNNLNRALDEARKNNDKVEIEQLSYQITKLELEDAQEWSMAFDASKAIEQRTEEILKSQGKETLERSIGALEASLDKMKAITNEEEKPSAEQLKNIETELEANKAALQKLESNARAEAEKQEKNRKEAELQTRKDNLLKPLTSQKLQLKDRDRINALSNLRNTVEISTLNKRALEGLKENVLKHMGDKTFKKLLNGGDGSIEFIHAMSLVRNRENVRFAHSLGKFKRNINKALYPTYGFQINALENYIQDLKDAGIKADNNPIKPVIFKSDRAKKLHLAQELLKDLIQFENKPKAEQAADTSITPGKIQEIIDSNKKATGPILLHGQGELDKILKNIKEKAANPQNESMSAKAHRKQKQRDSDSKLTAFRQALKEGSTHSFQGEIFRINQYRDKLYRNTASFPGFDYHFTKNGKENLKLSNQLIELLVNSNLDPKNDAESMRKREILESRVLAMLENPKLDKELRIVLDEINTRIKIPKAPGPKP